jgi:hypothetical protein
MDALGQALVVHRPVDRQVFNGDQIEVGDDAAAVLVGNATPPPGVLRS